MRQRHSLTFLEGGPYLSGKGRGREMLTLHSTATQLLLTYRPGCEGFIDDPVSTLLSAKPCQGSRAAARPASRPALAAPAPAPAWRPCGSVLCRARSHPQAQRIALPSVSSRQFSGRGPGTRFSSDPGGPRGRKGPSSPPHPLGNSRRYAKQFKTGSRRVAVATRARC